MLHRQTHAVSTDGAALRFCQRFANDHLSYRLSRDSKISLIFLSWLHALLAPLGFCIAGDPVQIHARLYTPAAELLSRELCEGFLATFRLSKLCFVCTF
jgi:hypothetical protein